MHRLVKALESWPVFVTSIIVLVGSGLARIEGFSTPTPLSARLSALSPLFGIIQAAYYLSALRLLTDVTPRLLGHLRRAVNISDEAFGNFAHRIVGTQTRHIFALLPPVMAALSLAALGEQIIRGANNTGSPWLFRTLTFAPLPYIAILFGAVSLWRMWGLMQLARQPLHFTLFDAGSTLSFVQLGSMYSALLMTGEMLHLSLMGSSNLFAQLITAFSTLSSLIALLLPLWAVHRQIDCLKQRTLKTLHAKIAHYLQTVVSDEQGEHVDIPATTASMLALNNTRVMVQSASTWPIASTFSTVRSFIVPFLPILYVLAQNLALPLFKKFLTGLGIAIS